MKKKHTAQAWVIWSLSALFMCYKYVLEVSPSVMTTPLMQTFHISATQLGNLVASYFYASLLLQLPAGLLLDGIGPRKITTCIIALCAIGAILFSSTQVIFLAAIGRFLMGIGAAFAPISCLKLTLNWFPKKQFAFMAGLMMAVAMLGAVGGQAPLAGLIAKVGWNYSLQLLGFFGFALALLFWIIVRDKNKVHVIKDSSTPPPIFTSLLHIIKHKQSFWLSIYSGLSFAPVMVFGGLWGVNFAEKAFAESQNIAAQSVSLIFIGFAVGAPLFGWFSDWLGKRRSVMTWGTLGALVSICAVIYLPTSFTAQISALLFFLFGFCISSFLLCFTMICEVHPALMAATAVSFMNTFNALFGAFSDPLAGKLLDLTWDGTLIDSARSFSLYGYKIAFLMLPIYLILALLCLTRIKETHCKHITPSSLP